MAGPMGMSRASLGSLYWRWLASAVSNSTSTPTTVKGRAADPHGLVDRVQPAEQILGGLVAEHADIRVARILRRR